MKGEKIEWGKFYKVDLHKGGNVKGEREVSIDEIKKEIRERAAVAKAETGWAGNPLLEKEVA